jgi:membrane fusion protein (multidrug efflux system)
VRLPYPQGAVVPAGTPLAEVADSKAVEVRLGVEPTEASGLAPGSAVPLQPVDGNGASAIEGRIRAVSPAINPATRLVEVYLTLPAGSHLSLGRYVSGLVTAASAKGLVVPYAAVLPGEKGSVLYTLKDARAVRHEVRVVIENGDEALVSAPDVKAGDPVVVSGNYELEGNMAVKVEPAP